MSSKNPFDQSWGQKPAVEKEQLMKNNSYQRGLTRSKKHMQTCRAELWYYELSSFQERGTKLERFLSKGNYLM